MGAGLEHRRCWYPEHNSARHVALEVGDDFVMSISFERDLDDLHQHARIQQQNAPTRHTHPMTSARDSLWLG